MNNNIFSLSHDKLKFKVNLSSKQVNNKEAKNMKLGIPFEGQFSNAGWIRGVSTYFISCLP